MGFSRPKRVRSRKAWASNSAAAGGGGGGGAGGSAGGGAGWEQLTAAKCVDHYSSGAICSYSGTPNFTLTDVAGVTQMRYINNINLSSAPPNLTRRLSVKWHDTGIKFSDIASIEAQIELMSVQGNPNGPNRKPNYGMLISGTYLVPHVSDWFPAPQAYLALGMTQDNGSNDFRFVALNDELFNSAGSPTGTYPLGYFYVPIHNQSYWHDPNRLTTRDGFVRVLRAGGDVNVNATLKDISTWSSLNRWWDPNDTLKIGIFVGAGSNWATLIGGEGYNFKFNYRVNKGRL